MESAKDTAWSQFWDERGRSYPTDNPIAIDGWDYGISRMGLEQAHALRKLAASQLCLAPNQTLLEVGCGAGMFLIPLSAQVQTAVGCDMSEAMIKRARQIDDQLQVQVAEANYLPYASQVFDAVLIYSVFHYFPSYNYAQQALNELLRVCGDQGRIWIGDIPDQTKREQALQHREQLMKQNTPIWPWPKLGPLEQRFYDPAFFVQFVQDAGCTSRIIPQTVKGYIQGQYRFNVLIEKG